MEMDQLPLYELQTMYYIFFKDKEAEAKMTKDEKAAYAMGKMIEDHV